MSVDHLRLVTENDSKEVVTLLCEPVVIAIYVLQGPVSTRLIQV